MSHSYIIIGLVFLSIWIYSAECNCVVDCFQLSSDEGSDLNGTLVSITDLTNHHAAKLVAANSAAENLTKFCRSIFQPISHCLQSCPMQDPLKEMTLKTLAVTDYACNRKIEELSPLWPCIKRVTDRMSNLCRSRCRRLEGEMMDILRQAKRLSSDLDEQSKTRILAVACTFAQCKNDCESPALEARCGSHARHLVQEMLLVSVVNVEDLTEAAQSTSFDAVWPKHCDRLKSVLTSSARPKRDGGLVPVYFTLVLSVVMGFTLIK